MHLLKVVFLLALTLAVMRGVSWTLGWLSFRFAKASRLVSTLIGNIATLGLFTGFLAWNLMPGEPFDFGATIFGVVVSVVYQVLDLYYCLWGGHQRVKNSPSQKGEREGTPPSATDDTGNAQHF